MPRPRAFDETQALDAAVDCFWRRGLEATSVRDLTAEMGLSGPSLYNTFGDKRALFARALERYADCSLRERIHRLKQQPSPKAAIGMFLAEVIERALADTQQRGCMIINAALDVPDDDLRGIVGGYLAEIEGFFRGRLEAARQRGEIPDSLPLDDMARLLLALQTGMRLMSRIRPERAVLEGMVRPALALLDHPLTPISKGTT